MLLLPMEGSRNDGFYILVSDGFFLEFFFEKDLLLVQHLETIEEHTADHQHFAAAEQHSENAVHSLGDDQFHNLAPHTACQMDEQQHDHENENEGDGLGQSGARNQKGDAFRKLLGRPASQNQGQYGGDFIDQPVLESLETIPAQQDEHYNINNHHNVTVVAGYVG